jgi:serine/threonine protein kinase
MSSAPGTKRLHEEIVAGLYPLGALIRRSARGTIYETRLAAAKPDGPAIPAAIRIREVDSAEAENLRHRLRNARQLAHPNLLKVYAAGTAVLNDAPIVYTVMERAEESLEEVLAKRALTESETREMLVPALDVLGYLHKNGYAHSRLKPSNVLAVNDQLKLSSESAIRLTDGGSLPEDMTALGALIVQALTRKIPNPDQNFGEIPQPLADIVRHCFDPDPTTRWTVEQVKARLSAPAVEAVPDARSLQSASPKRVPNWIFTGLAALILAVVLAAVVRNRNSAPPVATPVETPAAAPTAPPAAAPVPRPEPPPVASRPDSRKASGWSVIVGAYGAREPAEKWMREMKKKWPNFEISLLETQAEKTRYLVVLGKNLSEDQAEALRKRAVASGLPRNTYIKRVM